MSKPVGIDSTILTMREVLDRGHKDEAFRARCQQDLTAVIAGLDYSPKAGDTLTYEADNAGQVMTVQRGDDLTTCTLSAEGDFVIDSEALGVKMGDELPDEVLMAVTGGGSGIFGTDGTDCGCGNSDLTSSQKKMCKSACVCFNPKNQLTSWVGVEECYRGAAVCVGMRTDGRCAHTWQCDAV